jgi:hypothetical protein
MAFRRPASCIVTAIVLAACSGAGTANSVRVSAAPPYERLATLGPGPPVYVAIDYDKPGHPSLTLEQTRTIKEMLARVKPCQRSLLRYVPNDGVTLFFAVPSGQDPYVLGDPGTVYLVDTGGEIPVSDGGPEAQQRAKQGIQWDIDHQPCPHSSR